MPEWTVPLDGWLEVRVDGERMTCVEVRSGEEIEIELLHGDDSDAEN